MNYIMENLDYHINCMNVWEKEMQERPLTDEETSNYKEHKRIYRLLKDQLINPVRYRLRTENTLSGFVSCSPWFDTESEARQYEPRNITDDIRPWMSFTIESSSAQ